MAQVRYYCGHRRRWHRRQSIYDDTQHLYREMALAQLFNEGMGCQIFQQDRAPLPGAASYREVDKTQRKAANPIVKISVPPLIASIPSSFFHGCLAPFFWLEVRFLSWRHLTAIPYLSTKELKFFWFGIDDFR